MFDLTKEYSSNDLMVAGWYPAYIEKAEWKKSKTNVVNEYLSLQLRITGDKYNNKVVFHMLNLINVSEIARNIAMHDLKLMMIALGKEPKNISKEEVIPAILNQPLKIKVGIKKDAEFGDKNDVKSFDSMKVVTQQQQLATEECPF